ncbi:BSP-domain-containing protein [Hypoxylon sp. NC1633]|nr:BSP-domain-containing protein [Hypoxylon sp. NC1633]
MSRFDPDSNISEIGNIHISLTLTQDKKERGETVSPMPLPPNTTPVPKPIFMPGMSHRTEEPAPPKPSALPIQPKDNSADETETEAKEEEKKAVDLPRLRLHIQDVAHNGSSIFLSEINATAVLRTSIEAIHKHLYSGLFAPSPSTTTSTSASAILIPTRPHPPPTRSVTLILRDMDGVAYTTGSDLDSDHKEIHFSLRYISSIPAAPASRRASEIAGVLTHELVHCYQWNGLGSAPGGLIEGVADWVRLRCDLAPPHWNPGEQPAKWDAGYQHTAYFLQYLEDRFGEGTVRRLNEKLRKERYEEKAFWTEAVGGPVEQLFSDYKKTLRKDKS